MLDRFNLKHTFLAIIAVCFLSTAISPVLTSCVNTEAMTVASPDGKISLDFLTDRDGKPYYRVSRLGEAVVDSSALGLNCKEFSIGRNTKIKSVKHSTFDGTWQPVWGEESEIRNHYNEMRVELSEASPRPFSYAIVFRVFDDGIGFRYEFPEQENLDSLTILDELTEFSLREDGVAWSIPWNHEYYEHLYEPSLVSRIDTVCTPLTVKLTDSCYVAIHEAALSDYAAMNLRVSQGTRLTSYLTPWSTGEKVFTQCPFCTPWRTMIIVDKPGDLLLSRLMLNLNEPCRIDDTAWIQPQRYIGIWWAMHRKANTWEQGPAHGATTQNTKRYIDFAADHGYGGVLVEGWNEGWDGDWSHEGDKFSFTKAYPDFDIEEITRYAREKGVRLIGHHETGGAAANYEAQLDSAFALCQRLGINAVKTGYVNFLLDNKELHSSQYGVRHYRKVLETAARYGVMIDNHEPVMPTGLQRTYPNLMTQEGVRGCEYDAWSPDGGNPPEHTVTIPFTRCLAGPVDYTPGIFNYDNPVPPYTRPQCTVAKQLALALVLYSPLQMSADMIENYEGRPELEFLKSCPVNWARTVVPEAHIGEYLTIARKDIDSDNWYIGAITNSNARKGKVSLDFLDPGSSYTAKIFADGKDANFETNPYPVEISEIPVNSTSTLNLSLAKGGGAAIIISKN